MTLEDLRKALQPIHEVSTESGVSYFFTRLRYWVGTLVPEGLGSTPLSMRQITVAENAYNRLLDCYMCSGDKSELYFSLCSEIYDFVHNYMDTNHEVSINEYHFLSSIVRMYERLLKEG